MKERVKLVYVVSVVVSRHASSSGGQAAKPITAVIATLLCVCRAQRVGAERAPATGGERWGGDWSRRLFHTHLS